MSIVDCLSAVIQGDQTMMTIVTELPSQLNAVPGINTGLPWQHEDDTRLWFSNLSAELKLAKAYCHGYPRRQACLAGALERAEPTRVWGGGIFEHGRIIDGKGRRGRPRKATFGGDQI
jgi:WhiB family transcriptional regulator, redox-sensing transcriptional regulator